MSEMSLFTVSDIADALHEPPQRVAYIVRKHRLKPVHRVGIIRLFSEDQVKAIKQGLYQIQLRKN